MIKNGTKGQVGTKLLLFIAAQQREPSQMCGVSHHLDL